MKKRKLLFTMLALAMGCLTGGSGAMAQSTAGWEDVYAQTQTNSPDWTKLSSGNSSTGISLGSGSGTTYYYIDRSLIFTNLSGSGMKIQGTVYLYVPATYTLECYGSDANGKTGAGAGIELSSGNTLYIIGGGTVTARGGNAANGSDGGSGGNADYDLHNWTRTGGGGNGGNGGGGAGAGIGTKGGNGGSGGAGGEGHQYTDWGEHDGTDGSDGEAGATAGSMGTLYVANGTTVNATGGAKASSGGGGGQRGRAAADDDTSYNYTMAGGGGGGGGGFGGAASNIGTGGPGGGGGGGGAGGAQEYDNYNLTTVYGWGGQGGLNADGTRAGNGSSGNCTGGAVDSWLKQNGGWDSDDFTEEGDVDSGDEGRGGAQGGSSSGGTQHEGSLKYNITYIPSKTKLNGTNLDSKTVQYTIGGDSPILPQNDEGYQWVLLTYGKSCAPNGVGTSKFAQATTDYFGGDTEVAPDESDRTILLANVYGDLVFQEIATLCKLHNSSSNAQTLSEFKLLQYPVKVRLENRTLYKDNDWNTICLPFSMTADQIDDSPLAGALIYQMNSTTKYYAEGYDVYHYPVLYFGFESVTSIEAGKPYLVKWIEEDEFTSDGNLVDNTKKGGNRHELDFANMSITATSAGSWTHNNITFQGTFSPSADLTANDKTKLLLGPNSTLYYPSETINVGACRGYFVIPSSVANLLPDQVANAPQIVMDFGEGEATSIHTFDVVNSEDQQDAPVYNLNGQRLSAPQKGINIVNGKKVFVK